jgi:glycosyltransferase involved in cell wall biosynthesis
MPEQRPRKATRGRVVMLVDNKVEGDSRVQKEAQSAAERGWDVVLLGRSPDKDTHRWKIGDARVRLVPVPMPLAKRRYEYRRAPLRSPLAYPTGRLPGYVKQKAQARRAEARTQRDALKHKVATGELSSLSALPARAWVLANRAYAKAYADLVELRIDRTEELEQRRRQMDAPLDRLSTSFWQKTMGNRAWRKLDPNLWDWELALGPVIDRLKPDLIHANDFRMLGVGARAALRARGQGRPTKLVWDAHEYLPGINPWNSHPRWHMAQVAHEAEYAPYADAVVTVSETMVELLTKEHHLTSAPVIVRNAPTVGLEGADDQPGVRELCGIGADVPLLLYVGTMTPARGIDIMVDTLDRLDGVHVGFVARQTKHLDRIMDKARELEVADRVHHLPYVTVDRICGYISSADIGVFPALHFPNHEVDLPTKFYEYAQARLPMVVSDVRTTAETTRRLGVGEVFVAEDVEDYLHAVREVLAHPQRYDDAYTAAQPVLSQWMWDNQADALDAVYASLVPEGSGD